MGEAGRSDRGRNHPRAGRIHHSPCRRRRRLRRPDPLTSLSRNRRERASMSEERFDAIVIGTGQAGPPLAVRLAGAGRKTAILERKRFGGTCVNVGCIPTKTLVASARAAYVARRAADFGVMIDCDIRIDMTRVKARKDEVVSYSSQNIEKWLKSNPAM